MLSDKLQLSLESTARASELVCGNFSKVRVMLVAVLYHEQCDKQGRCRFLSCRDIEYLKLLQALPLLSQHSSSTASA